VKNEQGGHFQHWCAHTRFDPVWAADRSLCRAAPAISPLLTREGADVLFSGLKQQIKAREDKMPKEKDHELAEGYRRAGNEMSVALSERTIPY